MIIPTTKDRIFEEYLTLVNPLFKHKLTGTELRVLAKMYQIYFMYIHLGETKVEELLFHKETRLRIRQAIGRESKIVYTKYSMNNTIYWLKKKGFINKKELVHKIPYKNKTINLNLTLRLND